MSLKATLGTEALRVLRFLLQRGSGSFALAKEFVTLNELHRSGVVEVLADVYYHAMKDLEESAWGWTDSAFSEFADICYAPSELGLRLLPFVEAGLDQSDALNVPLQVEAFPLPQCRLHFDHPSAQVDLTVRAHTCFQLGGNMKGIQHIHYLIQQQVPTYVQLGACFNSHHLST